MLTRCVAASRLTNGHGEALLTAGHSESTARGCERDGFVPYPRSPGRENTTQSLITPHAESVVGNQTGAAIRRSEIIETSRSIEPDVPVPIGIPFRKRSA